MKSIMWWNVPSVPDPAKALKAAGFDNVMIKVADGVYPFTPSRNAWPEFGENVKPELVHALQNAGISVYGWGFAYGYEGEIKVAIEQVKRLELDGYLFDVEGQFETQARYAPDKLAWKFGHDFKEVLPDVPLGLCSWSLYWSPYSGAQWHRPDVATNFMSWCDFAAPMIYWDGTTPANVLWWIENSHKQLRAITDKPLIAVGRAYTGDGKGLPTAENVLAFARRAEELGYEGVSWWVLDQAIYKAETWNALREVNAGAPVEPIEYVLTAKCMIDHLNVRTAPHYQDGNERGGLMAGDVLEVCGEPVEDQGLVYWPLRFWCAEGSDGEVYLRFKEVEKK